MEVIVKREFLLKIGAAVALSVAGFLCTRFRISLFQASSSLGDDEDNGVDSGGNTGLEGNTHGLQQTTDDIQSENHVETITSPEASTNDPMVGFSLKVPGDNYTLDIPGFDEAINGFDSSLPSMEVSLKGNADGETPFFLKRSYMTDIEQENKFLKNIVRALKEKENCLEFQLLEYYGLEEQESVVMELKNQLEIKSKDAELLNLNIQSLKTNNKMLVAKNAQITAQLEMAHEEIRSLNSKLRCESEAHRDQILMLQQRVTKLQDEVQKNLDARIQRQKLKDLDSEDSGNPYGYFESGQIFAASALDDDSMELIEGKDYHFKEDEILAKETERLEADQFGYIEEVVYLRWLNACLRYELRDYQPAVSKTILARDLSMSLSPESTKKAKQLIHEYASNCIEGPENVVDFDSDHWCCSSSEEATCLSNSGELAETSSSSSVARTSGSAKKKLVNQLKRIVKGKDSNHASSMDGNLNSESLTDAKNCRFLNSSRRSITPSLKSELVKYSVALKGSHGLESNSF